MGDMDFFTQYLDLFPGAPSLVLIRSVELKNFPIQYLKNPAIDLCCGDGFFLGTLLNRAPGLEVVGCDIREQDLKLAGDRGVYKKVVKCDVRKLDCFAAESFSSAISNCALEHVDGIDAALTHISRILRPGGVLVATVPTDNINRWFPDPEKLEAYNRRQNHINILNKKGWAQLFSQHSFEMVESFYLLNENEYRYAIYFDAALELMPKVVFGLYSLFLRGAPKTLKKLVWGRLFRPIYSASAPLGAGGELVLVARKAK